MKSVSGKVLARLLERRGWALLQIHGSHHIYGREGSVVRLSIPIHGNTPLKIGLLKHLMKLAELSEEDLHYRRLSPPACLALPPPVCFPYEGRAGAD